MRNAERLVETEYKSHCHFDQLKNEYNKGNEENLLLSL